MKAGKVLWPKFTFVELIFNDESSEFFLLHIFPKILNNELDEEGSKIDGLNCINIKYLNTWLKIYKIEIRIIYG